MMHPKEPGGWQDAKAPDKPIDEGKSQQTQGGAPGPKGPQQGQKSGSNEQHR